MTISGACPETQYKVGVKDLTVKRKIIFLIATILLNSILTLAQAPYWEWAKSGTGTSDDTGQSIGVDASGNSYVTGYFDSQTISFGNHILTNAGSRNIFLVKYDPNGEVIWATSAGGTDNDIPGCIAVDANGNSYLTGRFYSPTITFDTIVLYNDAGSDVFVVKYDESGNVLWARSSVGSADDWGRGISLDPFGNVYIAGGFGAPNITFGPYTLTCVGDGNVFVTKYDIYGNVLWAKAAVGDIGIGYNWANSICSDTDGNSLVSGFFQSPTITFDTITLMNANNDLSSDIYIVKYNSIGNVIWAKSVGGIDADVASSISVDSDGNAYMAGRFRSPYLTFDTITITNDSGYMYNNIFVAKYNPEGNVLWVRAAERSNGCVIYTDSVGNSFLTGDFPGPTITFGSTTVTGSGGTDVFLVKYNASGDVLWAKCAGGAGGDYSRGVSADAIGNPYITGFFTSLIANFDTISLQNTSNSGYSQDFFIAKLNDVINSIPEEPFSFNNFRIYPNPANNKITIKTNRNIQDETVIHVLNINGEQILTYKFQSRNNFEMNVSTLKSGIYIVKIQTNVGVEIKRLLIQ